MTKHLQDKHTIHRGIDVIGDESKGLKAKPPNPPPTNTEKVKAAGQKAGDTLKLIDLFGRPVMLLTDNKPKYKSVVGGMISLWVIILIFLYLAYSVIFFVQRSGAIYSSVGETNSIPKAINIAEFNDPTKRIKSPQELVAGITITDSDEVSLLGANDKYINMTIGFYQKRADNKGNEKIGDLLNVNCDGYEAFNSNSTTDEEGNVVTFYQLYNLHEANCFRLDQYYDTRNTFENQNLTLIGNEINSEYSFIQIQLEVCKNSTESDIVCAPKEEIRKRIEKAQVKYIYTSKMFWANNTVQVPLKNITSFLEFSLTKRFARQAEILLLNNSLIDYWDLFDSNPKNNYFMSYNIGGDLNLDFVEEEEFGDFPLLILRLNSSKLQETYTRKFMTLKEFFVDVSGIVNLILAAGGGLGLFINKVMLKIDLINKTFFLVEDEAEIKKKEKDKKKGKSKKEDKKDNKDNKEGEGEGEGAGEGKDDKAKEKNKEDDIPEGGEIPKKKKKKKKAKIEEEKIPEGVGLPRGNISLEYKSYNKNSDFINKKYRDKLEVNDIDDNNDNNDIKQYEINERNEYNNNNRIDNDNNIYNERHSINNPNKNSKYNSYNNNHLITPKIVGLPEGKGEDFKQNNKQNYNEESSNNKSDLDNSDANEDKINNSNLDNTNADPLEKLNNIPLEEEDNSDLSIVKKQDDLSNRPINDIEEEGDEKTSKTSKKTKEKNKDKEINEDEEGRGEEDDENKNKDQGDDEDLEKMMEKEKEKESKKKKKKRRDSIKEEKEREEKELKDRLDAEELAAQKAKEGKVLNPFYKDSYLKIPAKPKIFRKFKMTFFEVLWNFVPFCNSKELLAKKKIFAECGAVIDSLTGIERIVQTIREYEEIRNVVLNSEDYKLLKQLTTPKIVIEDHEVHIKKIEKFNMTDKEIKANYIQFVNNMNKIIDSPYISKVELSLLEIHKEATNEPTPDKK